MKKCAFLISSAVEHSLKVVLFFLPFISVPSFAQIQSLPGYIVTMNHDTLSGFIEDRRNTALYQFCHFKKTKKEKTKLYAPSEIIGYGLTKRKYFESFSIKDAAGNQKSFFGDVILEGKISLFRYKNDLYVKHDSLGVYNLHFRETRGFNGARDYTGENKVKGLLNFFFFDCKTKRVHWDSLNITDAKIYELVENYNTCKNSSTTKYQNKVKLFKATVGLFAGSNVSSINLASLSPTLNARFLPDVKFGTNHAPIYGLSFALGFPWFSNNFSLYAEISSFKSNFIGHASGQGTLGKETEDVSLSMNYVKKAYGFRIQLPARYVTPFIKLGFSEYSSSHFSGVRVHTTYINNIEFPLTSSPWTSGFQNGYWLGVGLQKEVAKRLAFNLEVRFDKIIYGFPGIYTVNSFHSTFLMGLVF